MPPPAINVHPRGWRVSVKTAERFEALTVQVPPHNGAPGTFPHHSVAPNIFPHYDAALRICFVVAGATVNR